MCGLHAEVHVSTSKILHSILKSGDQEVHIPLMAYIYTVSMLAHKWTDYLNEELNLVLEIDECTSVTNVALCDRKISEVNVYYSAGETALNVSRSFFFCMPYY
jgi:hypothetical protein